jgi:hypothetical protein
MQAQILYVAPELNKLRQIRAAGYPVRAEALSPEAEALALSGGFDVVVIELGAAAGGAEFLAHVGSGLQALRTAVVAVGTSAVAGAAFAVPPGASDDLLLTTLRHAVLLNQGRRRRYARISINGTAEVRVGGAQWQAEITDIGHGGLALRCAVTVEVGTAARLSFRLPGSDRTLTATGEIRWREGERCGVLFRAVEGDGAEHLARWIAARASGEEMPQRKPAPPQRPAQRRSEPKKLPEWLLTAIFGTFALLMLGFWIYVALQ